MTREQIQPILDVHQEWLDTDGRFGEYANLSSLNLRHMDLSNLNLRNANFYNTNLSGSNLSNSDFTGACMKHAVLDDADITGVIGLDISAMSEKDVK